MLKFIDFTTTSQSQIINIVRRSLSYIDRRLIDHGERVAYIAGQMAALDPSLGLDRDKLLALSLLHDIGAYKTEEIDDMVRFETCSVTNHAVYGYVFLRNTTPLGRYAEAILYHHTDYDRLQQVDTPHKTMAELIFLADRVDILLTTSGAPDWQALRQLAGTSFSPRLVELFFAAEAASDISGHIRDGSFKKEIEDQISAVSLSSDEVISYLQLLVFSIDFRSPFTVTHTANTTAISTVLAQLFGLNDERQQAVAMGAFLHDIGKISIPYSILENPGRLTEAEMTTMRSHVAVSDQILRGIVPDQVCQIAVRHHEKLNGSGYHQGLQGGQLNLEQRIVAVADILSALIGRRSYKEPFPKERSVAILEGMCRAGELCPQVCARVTDNYDHIIRLTTQADDPVIDLYQTIRRQYEQALSEVRG